MPGLEVDLKALFPSAELHDMYAKNDDEEWVEAQCVNLEVFTNTEQGMTAHYVRDAEGTYYNLGCDPGLYEVEHDKPDEDEYDEDYEDED
jgi:hypothetical protein